MQTSPNKTVQPERLLRLPDVEALVGLRKSTIYESMRRGDFPTPVKLSRRAVCWPASAIDRWISERIKAGDVHAKRSELPVGEGV